MSAYTLFSRWYHKGGVVCISSVNITPQVLLVPTGRSGLESRKFVLRSVRQRWLFILMHVTPYLPTTLTSLLYVRHVMWDDWMWSFCIIVVHIRWRWLREFTTATIIEERVGGRLAARALCPMAEWLRRWTRNPVQILLVAAITSECSHQEGTDFVIHMICDRCPYSKVSKSCEKYHGPNPVMSRSHKRPQSIAQARSPWKASKSRSHGWGCQSPILRMWHPDNLRDSSKWHKGQRNVASIVITNVYSLL